MYRNHNTGCHREFDNVPLAFVCVMVLLFLVGVIGIFYSLPLMIVHLIDVYIFGEIIMWQLEMVISLFASATILFILSTVPKNPITWYIYLNTPIITIINEHENGSYEDKHHFAKKVEQWMNDNINSQWLRSRTWSINDLEYQFFLPSDAMAFKLKWI